MTTMFSVAERDETLHALKTLLQSDSQIIGLVLVGSGATDFQDASSDINLLVIVDPASTIFEVFQRVHLAFKEQFTPLVSHHLSYPDEYRWWLMLSNYLPLDFHFVRPGHLVLYQEAWKVLLDRAGDLPHRLEHAVRAESDDPVEAYRRVMHTIWLPIVKCVAAIRRKRVWQAMYLLEDLRERAVELAALNHQVTLHDYAGVDDLPEMFLVRLKHTLPTSTSIPALRRALRMTTDLLFTEASSLESGLKGIEIAETLSDPLLKYIDLYS